VELNGEDLSHFKKLNQLVSENVCIVFFLLRKCHSNKDKRLSEVAPHHGGKTWYEEITSLSPYVLVSLPFILFMTDV